MRPGKSRDGGRAPIEWGRAGVVALASTYPSSVFYGVPVISQLYGAQYTPYCVIIFVVCGAVLVPFVSFVHILSFQKPVAPSLFIHPFASSPLAFTCTEHLLD